MTSTCDRVKRYRERQKAGTLIATVEIPASIADSLTAMGLVEPFAPHVSGPAEMKKRGEALLTYVRALRKRISETV